MNLFKTKAGSSTAQESDECKLSAPLCVRACERRLKEFQYVKQARHPTSLRTN